MQFRQKANQRVAAATESEVRNRGPRSNLTNRFAQRNRAVRETAVARDVEQTSVNAVAQQLSRVRIANEISSVVKALELPAFRDEVEFIVPRKSSYLVRFLAGAFGYFPLVCSLGAIDRPEHHYYRLLFDAAQAGRIVQDQYRSGDAEDYFTDYTAVNYWTTQAKVTPAAFLAATTMSGSAGQSGSSVRYKPYLPSTDELDRAITRLVRDEEGQEQARQTTRLQPSEAPPREYEVSVPAYLHCLPDARLLLALVGMRPEEAHRSRNAQAVIDRIRRVTGLRRNITEVDYGDFYGLYNAHGMAPKTRGLILEVLAPFGLTECTNWSGLRATDWSLTHGELQRMLRLIEPTLRPTKLEVDLYALLTHPVPQRKAKVLAEPDSLPDACNANCPLAGFFDWRRADLDPYVALPTSITSTNYLAAKFGVLFGIFNVEGANDDETRNALGISGVGEVNYWAAERDKVLTVLQDDLEAVIG